jgi:hypothetical protein
MAQADTSNTPSAKGYNGSAQADIGDIRQDIISLKESVRSLTKHLQKDGIAKAGELKESVSESLDTLLAKSDEGLVALEEQIKANPRRSLVVAFMAGFALNLLMRKE